MGLIRNVVLILGGIIIGVVVVANTAFGDWIKEQTAGAMEQVGGGNPLENAETDTRALVAAINAYDRSAITNLTGTPFVESMVTSEARRLDALNDEVTILRFIHPENGCYDTGICAIGVFGRVYVPFGGVISAYNSTEWYAMVSWDVQSRKATGFTVRQPLRGPGIVGQTPTELEREIRWSITEATKE